MTTLADVEQVAARWLGDTDPQPLRGVLAAYASHRWLTGDPVWLGLVGGSGVGKTERLMALAKLPGVKVSSAVTSEGALLSASPRRSRSKDATGGLLRELGADGFLVLKDLTTLLSMHYEHQSTVFAAFREIYDGAWIRSVGTDGARSVTWEGRLGFVFGCTTELDRRRGFLSTMGERFVLVRLDTDDRSSDQALANVGREPEMRRQLAATVNDFLGDDQPPHTPHRLDRHANARLSALAILATSARSPVARDYRGEIDLVLDRESPNRFVKQLAGLWRGAGVIGLDRDDTMRLVVRAALDSIPDLRRQALVAVMGADAQPTTGEIAATVNRPYRTVLRALEDLEAHNLVGRFGQGEAGRAHHWFGMGRTRELWERARLGDLATFHPLYARGDKKEEEEEQSTLYKGREGTGTPPGDLPENII